MYTVSEKKKKKIISFLQLRGRLRVFLFNKEKRSQHNFARIVNCFVSVWCSEPKQGNPKYEKQTKQQDGSTDKMHKQNPCLQYIIVPWIIVNREKRRPYCILYRDMPIGQMFREPLTFFFIATSRRIFYLCIRTLFDSRNIIIIRVYFQHTGILFTHRILDGLVDAYILLESNYTAYGTQKPLRKTINKSYEQSINHTSNQ